jgi:hypothetical protein
MLERIFFLTIMSYHDCIIFTTWLFILKQAPEAIEWLQFAYPTRTHNLDQITLHQKKTHATHQLNEHSSNRKRK